MIGTEPRVLSAAAEEGPARVDRSMQSEMSFEGNIEAHITTSLVAEKATWPEAMTFRAWGEGGELEVLNPMAPLVGPSDLGHVQRRDGSRRCHSRARAAMNASSVPFFGR